VTTHKKPIQIKTDADFEQIFKEYYNPLLNFINQFIKNKETSKEIIQITFMKMWDKRAKLKIESSLKSYLYRSAKNSMIDYIRKHDKIKVVSDEDQHIINNLPDIDDDYLSPYIIRNEILRAMEELKPKNREIFRLSKLEGLTYEEIANHLNISKRSVEDNVARATALIKTILEKNSKIFD
jgi:RNA polymerase sigma-70 factor (ECF subfamily)